jgi:DNA polymerase elongation subunit (family B)
MLVTLDIETVKPPKSEWASIRGISLNSGEDDAGAIEKEYERSVFDGTFGRIVCIGVLVLRDDLAPEATIAWYGPNEKSILQQFWSQLAILQPSLIITHNGLGFDLPFIMKRSIIHEVRPSIDVSLARFRRNPVFDTMAEWSNWDPRSYVKLDVLARALGVDTKSGSGHQVEGMVNRNEWEELARYCLQDVYVTYACYCSMTFQEPRKSIDILSSSKLIMLDA